MKLSELLSQCGVLSTVDSIHEVRRLKRFAKILFKHFGTKNQQSFTVSNTDCEKISMAIDFCRKLYRCDVRKIEHVPYTTSSDGLAHVFYRAIAYNQPITFLSLASNAIQIQTRTLKEKKQYELPNVLLRTIESITADMGIRWYYRVLLADDDYLTPRESFDDLWQQNLAKLQSLCRVPVDFMSVAAGCGRVGEVRLRISTAEQIQVEDEAKRFENVFVQTSFKTSLGRNIYQMKLYSSIGIWLEQEHPNSIVLDIQKQMYPYEQPYLNRFRKVPLPLIRCAKK